MRTPNTQTGTAPAILVYDGGPTQVFVNNKDATNTLTLSINGDSGAMTIESGGKRGVRINGGIYSVILGGTAAFEVTTF